MQTNTNITVYNKYYDKLTRMNKWKRTQIEGQVFWDSVKAASIVKAGIENANTAVVYIPLTSANEYVSPREFEKNQTGWTLNIGDKIAKGLVNLEVNNVTELEKQLDDVITITSVDPKLFGSFRMRHYFVGGQ